MTTSTFELFFSLLTWAAMAGVVVIVSARVLRTRSTTAGSLVAAVAAHRFAVCAVLSGVSMAGSLYFSEVANFTPCTLCWYQRIAMYSLAIICTIAAWRGDDLRVYVVTLASLGAIVSTYHWLLERFPDLDAGVCSATVPCEAVWFERFGFITLPFMAFTAFAGVIAVATLPTALATIQED